MHIFCSFGKWQNGPDKIATLFAEEGKKAIGYGLQQYRECPHCGKVQIRMETATILDYSPNHP